MAMSLLNKISYPTRLFLWLLCYSLLMVCGFVSYQYCREKEFKAEELNLRLQLVNERILTDLGEGKSIEETVRSETSQTPELRVSLINRNGRVVYDNFAEYTDSIDHAKRSEIAGASERGAAYTVRRQSESTGQSYFYSATRGENGMIVRTAMPYDVSLLKLLEVDYGFLRIMGLIVVLMCVLGYFATGKIGRHISRLSAFADKAEKGEKIYDTAPFPDDELGRISNNIVRLYARLQQAIADRDREHREAFRQQQEKERIKKQLTNNINHELKTPVASIDICIDTILAHPEMEAGKRTEFLYRCKASAERLKRLLADVSVITRLDDGGMAIEMEETRLDRVIADVVAECEPMASAKGIQIECNSIEPTTIRANQDLLSSVFRNLIDNAIAYSGGNKIDIRCVCMNDNLIITVADNGSGVPDEHLPRLFERFYRIDKGRSRSAGGTGLGLAIVKNAVLLHGGSVEVEKLSSGGLIFKIILPAL